MALWKWASIQSSNSTPTMPEGMMAAMTLNHSCHVCFFSPSVFRGENGLSLWKNRTITARIAPSWMTTSNMLRNSSETFRVMNSFSKIRCPVEEIGSHSVTPSTMPKSTAFNSSIKSVSFFQFKESMNKSLSEPSSGEKSLAVSSRRFVHGFLGQHQPLPGFPPLSYPQSAGFSSATCPFINWGGSLYNLFTRKRKFSL